MGALSLIVYNMKNPPIDITFTESFMAMKPRGPDDTNFVVQQSIPLSRINMDQAQLLLSKREIREYKQFTFMYGYHRLSINDLTLDGSQPFEDPIPHKVRKYPELRARPKRKLLCNGEIYNYHDLVASENLTERDLQSKCDVEIILPMYIKYGIEGCLDKIKGDYSFVLTENVETYDVKSIKAFVVRDILGTKPLYMIRHTKEFFYMFASEIKGIPSSIVNDSNYEICEVPPGTYWSFQNALNYNQTIRGNGVNMDLMFTRYHDWNVYKGLHICTIDTADPNVLGDAYKTIKEKLTSAVTVRNNLTNVPVGVLLSGFDSGIILSILAHNFQNTPLYAFTMGYPNSPDVISAQKCVEYLENKLGIDIHHHIINIADLSNLLGDIETNIKAVETYDPTVVRQSLPYTIMFKYIQKQTDIKVLLTGEGLDELCGYKEFTELSDEDFQSKSVKLIKNISKYDIQRSDKLASSFNLEVRHPFLDEDFIKYVLTIHPKLRRPQKYAYNKPPIEKYIIRKAFDVDGVLNYETLWKPIQDASQCFDDLHKRIKAYIDSMYTEQQLYDFNTLNRVSYSKEEMHYKLLFTQIFGKRSDILSKFWYQLWE
jgi:asparagine synthase (glutamine-hydrolysing)